MAHRRHFGTVDYEETEPLYGSTTMQEQVVKPWDVFEDRPRKATVGSAAETKYLDLSIRIMKVVTYIIVFLIVLGTAIVSKGTVLFMVSQIQKNVTRPYCNKYLDINKQFIVTIPELERVTWIWFLIFTFLIPELGTFIRSVRICCFKSWTRPSFLDFIILLVTEICPAIGTAILIFVILPELDVVKGAMLTNAVCFVPAVVSALSRKPKSVNNWFETILDILSVLAQASSFVIWPILENKPVLLMIPVAVILISIGWWENFVSTKSKFPFIRHLAESRKEFKNKTYFLYIFVSVIKSLVFFSSVLVIYWVQEGQVQFLFDNFYNVFQDHQIYVKEIEPFINYEGSPNYNDAIQNGNSQLITTSYMTPIWVWIICFLTTYICYAFGKFACKVMIQGFSYAFPVNLSVPVLLSGLIAMCGSFNKNECSFSDTIPSYLFFNTPPLYFLNDFVSNQHAWVWLIWLLSQTWITIHIWRPNRNKLDSTEKIFFKPMYDAFLIDQSLAMNRRKTLQKKITEAKSPDIPRIYACGTMWHETKEEMMEFLKSIIRLDIDQSANRLVRNYLQYDLDSYYEFETHIFFDDAFVRQFQEDPDPHINEFVENLITSVDEAASEVHQTTVRIRPPKKYETPYGGRLVWTLPGKTKMIAHLKDKKKIRAKKRWSQVMYMYYLLGYKIMDNDEIIDKDNVAENTYILALDGDIDFRPEAVHLLVDYMKKNKSLGAACGRIHPIGSGAMAWYQMFEYAVGHWLQKATEHVFGCVLCSPGCFSLFRGKALMDHSVMRKYTTKSTQAAHYVQYDQGEDRWLCTLLLQRGYRVEYSAASDAFTHCPEGFNEFYNQRRRWMPSTMANIIDLLMDYKHTVEINDNISQIYIFYQGVLMAGTVLGPGTIFVMLIGAFVAAFKLDQWTSLYWNLAPILVFVIVCATCSSDIQLFFAGVISAIYGLVMMAVFVGVMLQISEDGFLAPSSLFFFCMAGEMIIAAMLHPKEFNCLKYGVIYYVTVPSMYMLLVIYSVFNMNNVSWGTREVTVVIPQKKEEPGKETKKVVETQPKKPENKILSFFGANEKANSGSIEFSLAGLFKCLFCTHVKEEDPQLKQIQHSMDTIMKKIEVLEHHQLHPDIISTEQQTNRRVTISNKRPTIIEGSRASKSVIQFQLNTNTSDGGGGNDDDDDEDYDNDNDYFADDISSIPSVAENSWFYDSLLMRSEADDLDRKETQYWNDVLDKYLLPIDDTDHKDRIKQDLKDLRDKMVFSFFMLNSLYVLVVFLLTLQKDTLHINWPINPKVNFTYISDTGEIHLHRSYLQLEPIGFVFLFFFAFLLVIQFICMIIHRFATYSQILTNTNLEFDYCQGKLEDLTPEEILAKDPLKFAKELQQLKGINNEDEDLPEQPVERRTTIHAIAKKPNNPVGQINDLDAAFTSRLEGKNASGLTDEKRKSIAIVNQRRQTILRRQSRLSQFIPENDMPQRIVIDSQEDYEV